ncbi:DM13 domain-containing protein [Gloeocapsa sp. PCC 73106]|uniref:DM13 domain-containing protein n=1 Tax=Gloeocapsa sp. PCC 73106 TaxID=102232 RepID=UPI0002AC3F8D|nr:DM13 domain-containing protein [Gloeocapsa sp. PCC 73106]ELR98465.1 electron transfer protein with DM13 domain [Gloeocapsa sp. PCC 73106]
MNLSKLTVFGLSSALLVGSITFTLVRPSTAEVDHLSNSESTQLLLTQNPLKSGTFVTTEQDHPTKGTARIITENGQRFLEFDSAFNTAMGPDVQVILHRSGEIAVKPNAQDYVILAPLQSFNGSQRYAIPENLDVEEFQSVGIWCRQFDVTFGYAAF